MRSIRGRVVAITGAGSGIGRALAHACAAEGAQLALADIDAEALAETAAEVGQRHPAPLTTRVDVSDRAQVEGWAAAVVERYGAVHVVVNNAGVAVAGTVEQLTIEDYAWVMGVNFWGVVYGTKAFLPHLEAAGEGHIVNVSSVFGLTAQPLMSGYNASKFAVRGFTESLRQDLELRGSCVSATCVHPGGIQTNIAKAARFAQGAADLMGRSESEAARAFESLFINTPAKAAEAILEGIHRDRRRVLIGPDAHLLDWGARLLPTGYQRLFTAAARARSRTR